MRFTLILLASCVFGCSATHEPTDCVGGTIASDLDQPFTLRVGDRAILDGAGVQVHLSQVTEDSRCPSNPLILCAWEGDGAVLVRIERPYKYSLRDTLHTTLDPKTLAMGDFTLELQQLDPYPETTEPIPQGDYVATFVLHSSHENAVGCHR